MVKINFEQMTYVFRFDNFNNNNIIDYNKGSLLISIILNSKVIKGTSQKYDLNKFDLSNDLYLTLSTGFNIPIKSMFFKDNASKLKGLYSFSMSTSLYCNGLKYNTCNAIDKTNNKNYCYGCNFERCRTNKNIINSIESNFISSFIFYHANNKKISKYINLKQIDIIRFNNHGSFIDNKNIYDLFNVVSNCKNTLIYGYIEYKPIALKLKDICKNLNNIVINGSNFMVNNNFFITSDLRTFFNAGSNRCLSDCINCKKCFKALNKTNINLLHGLLKDIDNAFNNESNIKFIESFFNNEYKIKDYKGKYFLTKVKNMLKQINIDLSNKFDMTVLFEDVNSIKNYKDLIFYLESNYL